MRFKTGLVIGLAAGYYFGSRAGRERYEQIEEWLDRLRSAAAVRQAKVKLGDGLREGTTTLLRLIDDAFEDAHDPMFG